VIAHNEAAGIQDALASILAQEGLDRQEVVVVDDGSTDRTAELVANLAHAFPALRLIRLEQNRGRGFARHAGVSHARGRMIATVDADIILPPRWASQCIEMLATADAVGGTAVPDGDVAYLSARFGLNARPVPHEDQLTGNNAVYRAELFDRVSFDPGLRDGEDVALNHALRAIGARVRTMPGLVVEHRESKSLAQSIAWLFQSGRGATRQLSRYRQLRVPDVVFAGWLLSALAAAVLRRRGHAGGSLLLIAYSGAAALAHVRRAFIWERRTTLRFAGAVLLDMALLNSYFGGRVVGIGATVRDAVLGRRRGQQ
jgi:glycosyltransferase involved in cell wall biosynthesis